MFMRKISPFLSTCKTTGNSQHHRFISVELTVLTTTLVFIVSSKLDFHFQNSNIIRKWLKWFIFRGGIQVSTLCHSSLEISASTIKRRGWRRSLIYSNLGNRLFDTTSGRSSILFTNSWYRFDCCELHSIWNTDRWWLWTFIIVMNFFQVSVEEHKRGALIHMQQFGNSFVDFISSPISDHSYDIHYYNCSPNTDVYGRSLIRIYSLGFHLSFVWSPSISSNQYYSDNYQSHYTRKIWVRYYSIICRATS